MLVGNLPSESALNTAIRNDTPSEEQQEAGDPTRAPWSTTDSLLATVVDELRMLQYIHMQQNSKKKLQKPKPIPRPGIGQPKGRLIDVQRLKEMDPRLRGLSDEDAIAKYKEMTRRV